MSIVTKVWDSIRGFYTRQVVAELNAYGLRYQDLYLEDDTVVKALDRLTPEERIARERRIKRAIDVSLKKKYLPAEVQAVQQPMNPYLQAHIEDIEAEKTERALLNP